MYYNNKHYLINKRKNMRNTALLWLISKLITKIDKYTTRRKVLKSLRQNNKAHQR